MRDQLGDPLDGDEIPSQPREVDRAVAQALAPLPTRTEYSFQESIFCLLGEVEDAIRWEAAC